ncbi:hypothetical protein ATE92_0825 [Ulvibacter sp. MAR_2010_11]|uniref:hypothetical protein n=1 Tax=Ulvibacter sp. MAR_2010_11 TaxID=1250229 RepID=UPI000C2C1818|nr:hypothetical protein [Ulvibacter sp. MAR_2010_11]PKA82689.1 hypothetical protein ATE92_0825 [Ulvibacter sp. MAR_2010_11]
MKISLFIITLLLVVSCKKDDGVRNDNPYLIDPLVSLNLNLNLPEYNPLNFPGNSIIINSQGIRGIVVYNVNNDLYTAFELSDPNHTPSNCSKMTVEGIIATCPCNDDNSYDIVTGQHQTNENRYPMLQYLANRTGNNIQISN